MTKSAKRYELLIRPRLVGSNDANKRQDVRQVYFNVVDGVAVSGRLFGEVPVWVAEELAEAFAAWSVDVRREDGDAVDGGERVLLFASG